MMASDKTVAYMLILSMILFSETARAQNFERKWFVEVSDGPSFALGPFKSIENNIASNNDSFDGGAKTGVTGRLLGGKYLKKNAGFVFSLDLFVHQINIVQPPATSPQEQIFIGESDPWKIGNLGVGAFYEIPLNNAETWLFNFKGMLGAAKTSVPAYSFYHSTSSNGLNSITKGTRSKRELPLFFSYQMETGISFKVKDNFFITFHGRYFNARTKHQRFSTAGLTQPGFGSTPTPLPQTPVESTYVVRTFSPLLTLRFLQQSW